jgi:hypothetical protein
MVIKAIVRSQRLHLFLPRDSFHAEHGQSLVHLIEAHGSLSLFQFPDKSQAKA